MRIEFETIDRNENADDCKSESITLWSFGGWDYSWGERIETRTHFQKIGHIRASGGLITAGVSVWYFLVPQWTEHSTLRRLSARRKYPSGLICTRTSWYEQECVASESWGLRGCSKHRTVHNELLNHTHICLLIEVLCRTEWCTTVQWTVLKRTVRVSLGRQGRVEQGRCRLKNIDFKRLSAQKVPMILKFRVACHRS